MKRKFKGFTLIELIVVVTIIGILATILVPAMLGYISKSKIGKNNANAKSIFLNASAVINNSFNETDDVLNGTLYNDIGTGLEEASYDLCNEIGEEFHIALKTEADFAAGKWTWAINVVDNVVVAAVAADRSNIYVGGFPVPCPVEPEYRQDPGGRIYDYLVYAIDTGKLGDASGAYTDGPEEWPKREN